VSRRVQSSRGGVIPSIDRPNQHACYKGLYDLLEVRQKTTACAALARRKTIPVSRRTKIRTNAAGDASDDGVPIEIGTRGRWMADSITVGDDLKASALTSFSVELVQPCGIGL
jgi:hypothetical protein